MKIKSTVLITALSLRQRRQINKEAHKMSNKIILLAIAFVSLINTKPVSADTPILKEKILFRDMNNTILLFRVDCERYPKNLQELKDINSCPKWQQRGEPVSIRDYWGRPYRYSIINKRKESRYKFELHSYGEDGIANTADDIRN